MQVAHTGQHGSSTQPANLAKVKQITVMELAVIQAAIDEVGILGAQSLLVNAVHLAYGLGMSGGLTVAGVSWAGLQCYCRVVLPCW